MRVFKCKSCSRLHLEIGNTQIHFATLQHLKEYLERLDSIDVEYYAAINRGKGLSKVIILPLDSNNSVQLGFTVGEFKELKQVIRDYVSNDSILSCLYMDLNSKQFKTICLN